MANKIDQSQLSSGARSKGRNRRIKVMLAIDGLGLGGAEIVVRDLVRYLDREWFDVCVCCTRGLGGSIGEELIHDGFDVFVLEGQHSARVDYLAAVKFWRAVKDRGIDLVHTHALPALLHAAPCRLMMQHLKLVHTFHFGNYPYDSFRYRLMEGFCTRAVDRLIAVGKEQRRRLRATYRLAEDRIGIVWNGVTLAFEVQADRFRQEVSSRNLILVGTIAKLIQQKGIDDLFRVARQCRDNGYKMQFVVVGDGPLRPMLEEQRRELGLNDTVVITGWIPNAGVRALPAFDVLFQPSRWEAMSIVILEAMANGKPIIATRVGDNQHVLENHVSGLIVEPGDIGGMVRALAQVTSSELRDTLGRAARARYEQEFTVEHMIHAYEKVYRELFES